MKDIVILGAGISGLSVGLKLSTDSNLYLLEKESFEGGLCASFTHKDCILDYGPHKLYSQLPGIMEEFSRILGEDCLSVKKKNSLRFMGKCFEFPMKITQLIKNISPKTVANGIGIGLGYSFTLLSSIIKKKENITYEDYFINGFGRQGYNVLFRDLAWKVWDDPKLLTEELARKRVPIPSISNLIKSAFSKKEEQKVSAEYYYYPKKGCGMLCDKIADKIKENKGEFILNSSPSSINLKDNRVESITYGSDKETKTLTTDLLISTIPISELPKLINPLPPEEVLEAANNLKYKALIIIYLTIDTPKLMDDAWIFCLDNEVMFNRVAEQKAFGEFTIPKDKTVLMIDLTAKVGDNTWNQSDEELINSVINDLKKIGVLKEEKIIDSFVKRIKKVYPLYHVDYKKNLTKILDYISTIPNLYTIGRHGTFNYNNMDHCIDMSYIAAEHISKGKTKPEWKQKREYFESYRIVD